MACSVTLHERVKLGVDPSHKLVDLWIDLDSDPVALLRGLSHGDYFDLLPVRSDAVQYLQ